MKQKFLLVALVAVLAFHWRAFSPGMFPPDATDVHYGGSDVYYLIQGYHQTPGSLAGIIQYQATGGSYRPLSAAYFYLQSAVIEAGYPQLVTAATLIMFALCCALAGLLVRRWTSDAGGMAAAALAAAVPQTWGMGKDHFAWFPIADNTLCLLFLLPALLYFDRWLSTQNRRDVAAALGLMVLACFSKEFAYVAPFIFGAMVVFGSERDEAFKRLRPVALAFAVVFVMALQRRFMVPVSRDTFGLNWWMAYGLTADFWRAGVVNGLLLMIDKSGAVLVSSLPALFLLAIYPLWRVRRPSKIATGLLLAWLSFLPVAGSNLLNHRLMFIWTFGTVAVVPVALALLEKLKEVPVMVDRRARDTAHGEGHRLGELTANP